MEANVSWVVSRSSGMNGGCASSGLRFSDVLVPLDWSCRPSGGPSPAFCAYGTQVATLFIDAAYSDGDSDSLVPRMC